MAKKKILTDNGQEILPITHEDCVLDNNGVSIGSKIGNINELATDSRTDLVSAINNILEFKDNMKQEAEELKQENEEIRNTLIETLIQGGYDISDDEDIDVLLELISTKGSVNRDIKKIYLGGVGTESTYTAFIMILKYNGELYGCGYNGYGGLGLGDTNQKPALQYVTNNVKEVGCGGYHTFILKNDDTVWACGWNSYGQLGLGDNTNRTTFTQVNISDVKNICCGGNHTFIIKNDGSVWSCGYNQFGQLGLDDTTDRTTFTQVTTNINNDVKQIDCGYYHTVILKNDGSVYSCGYNGYGQLGLGDTTKRTTFTQVTTNINIDVEQIACGYYHTFILKNDGSVYSCGYNTYGQLGLGDTTQRNTFTQVTTNINNDVKTITTNCCVHTFILKNDGSIWGCGNNGGGQLGLGTSGSGTNKTSFTQVTTNIDNDVEQITCSGYQTLILKTDGLLYGCGYNNYLGLGAITNAGVTTFTQIPNGFSY